MDNRQLARLIARHADTTRASRQGTVHRDAPPGVTIAIPNWNHELVLPRAIQSALAAVDALRQTHIPAEVLVVDDESRDGSLTLLRQLEALYYMRGLRVLALAHNQGLAEARNQALRHARYRHILFLDADNELIADNVPLFYRAIQQTGAAVVYGNLFRKQHGAQDVELVVSNESFQPYMFEWSIIDACALFDRLQVLDAGGYTTAAEITLISEDWELYLHLAASGRLIVFVPVVFATYYVNPGSMFLAYKEQDEHIALIRKYIQRVFDQFGIRQQQPLNTLHKRYHPDVGYL
jgi:glycosyltransferase involved in cell wall biosynthesis